MRERAYRFRFYPSPSQENLLRRTMGCVRLVYNKALPAFLTNSAIAKLQTIM
ncbi:helix-turn-helix domain-containing protein [Crocosphaera watsonii WH 8501]|uniref:helix-turn-helix domain-containing protein n=1 Tax=Crocosphaera watsonii TaxID=263511 RepID=UPI0003148F94